MTTNEGLWAVPPFMKAAAAHKHVRRASKPSTPATVVSPVPDRSRFRYTQAHNASAQTAPVSSSATTSPPAAATAATKGTVAVAEEMDSVQPPCLVRPLVVLFGDSLTQFSLDPEGGWGAALAHHLQRRVDLLNRGLAGYSSQWALQAFDQVLQEVSGHEVALLTIWLGANDAAIPGRSAEVQHVPLAEYRSNLASMVSSARQAGIDNLLLITPPPVHDNGRVRHQQQMSGDNTPVLPNKSLQYTQHYADAVLDLGRELQLPVVDLYSRLQAVHGWQTKLLSDGLHFTPAGSMAVWQEVQEVLEAHLPQLSPGALPAQFPLWDQIDHTNFEQYWRDTLPTLANGSSNSTNPSSSCSNKSSNSTVTGSTSAGGGRPLAVLFGDSLTQYSHDPEGGWGAALAHHLQRRVDVISRGHSGYNSRWGLKVFEQVVQQLVGREVVLLTIWLGANDAAIPGRSAKIQHVPLPEYRSNLASMVSSAHQAGIDNLLLITPPPVHDNGRVRHQQQKAGNDLPVLPDRSFEYTQQYADAVLDLARELQLPVVDLYSRLQAVQDWQAVLLKDGLHFTPAGSTAVWRELKAVLDEQLPQVSPESLPAQFPEWDQADYASFKQKWQTVMDQAEAPPS